VHIEIQSDRRMARLDGAELSLGARAFDVLAYLHRHADRVVTKAELLDHVWSGMIVEEGNLSVQIAGLRKALGKEAIKTVPGVGYRLTPGASAPAPATGPDLPSIPSLAVLPFANLTGDERQDYLADGIVTEIIAALSRVSGFFVISSTSSFTYKGRAVDLAEVGRELGVRYVLEGSVQKAGDRLRIFTQLVEAETGHTIWQNRFDGNGERNLRPSGQGRRRGRGCLGTQAYLGRGGAYPLQADREPDSLRTVPSGGAAGLANGQARQSGGRIAVVARGPATRPGIRAGQGVLLLRPYRGRRDAQLVLRTGARRARHRAGSRERGAGRPARAGLCRALPRLCPQPSHRRDDSA
jgi:TolB-like protein